MSYGYHQIIVHSRVPDTFDLHGDCLAIGCESGDILFFELSSKCFRSWIIRRRSLLDSLRSRPKVLERPRTMYV